MKPKNSYLRDARQGVGIGARLSNQQAQGHSHLLRRLDFYYFFLETGVQAWFSPGKRGMDIRDMITSENLASINHKRFLAELVCYEMRFIEPLSDHEHHLHHRSIGRRTSGRLPKLM